MESTCFRALHQSTDVTVCIFDQGIVRAFCPPPITDEPASFQIAYFKPMDSVATVESIMKEMGAYPSEADDRLRRHLLIGLNESKVGKYSMYHENAIYMHGYNDPVAIHLAVRCVLILASFIDSFHLQLQVHNRPGLSQDRAHH